MDMLDEFSDEDTILSDSDDDQLQFSGDEREGKSCGRSGDRDPNIADCSTLTPDRLSKKMYELINEVNAVFQVSLLQ